MDGEYEPIESAKPPGLGETVPAPLLAQWRAAEERLYPMVLVIPEGYERVVRLVGATTVELQLACRDLPSLVEEAPRVAARVRRLAAASGIDDELDFSLIGAAACMIRHRQLSAETHHQQRIRRIAAAAEAGASWVVLEAGAPATSWPPLPSTTVEMHLPTGRALEMTTALDEATGAPRFHLAEVQLVPGTGERGSPEVSESEFSDLQAWRSAIESRRQTIESGI